MNKEQKTNPIDLIRTLKALGLSTSSRARMRAALSAYADLHAAPSAPARPGPGFSLVDLFRSRRVYAGALSLVLVVAASTQATFASEKALPGDILYSVKVAFAEPVALALSVSDERKAELAAQYATRRVDEAAALSVRGDLDEETAEELAVRFDEHVAVLARETEELEEGGDAAVSLAVRSSLERELTEKTDALAPPEEEDSTGMRTAAFSMAVAAEDDIPARFKARIHERTRALAITRDRLADAVAVEPGALADSAASAIADSRPQEGADEARLFLAAEPAVSATLMLAEEAPATTTATTTDTDALEGEEDVLEATRVESPAVRLFSPFFEQKDRGR